MNAETNTLEAYRLHMKAVLHELLNIGELMLSNGAEVNRVEDTVTRLGYAYGAEDMNVFVITSNIVVTMGIKDCHPLTESRRILNPGGTNFSKIEQWNQLSREVCASPIPAEEFSKKIYAIDAQVPAPWKFYVGNALAGGGFALFFGGNIYDAIVATIFGIIITVFQTKLEKYCANKTIFNLLSSFAVGIAICLLTKVFPQLHEDKIMIGDIMLLIPGIAMTNSIRDIIVGDTISGLMRLVETLLWAFALACGFICAIWLVL